jgi:hypothetical protein
MHTLWVVRHLSKSAIRAWSDLRQLRSSIEVIELHTQGRPLPVHASDIQRQLFADAPEFLFGYRIFKLFFSIE